MEWSLDSAGGSFSQRKHGDKMLLAQPAGESGSIFKKNLSEELVFLQI